GGTGAAGGGPRPCAARCAIGSRSRAARSRTTRSSRRRRGTSARARATERAARSRRPWSGRRSPTRAIPSRSATSVARTTPVSCARSTPTTRRPARSWRAGARHEGRVQAENEPKLRAVDSLLAGGLATLTEPVPVDDAAFGEILAELRQVERDDVARKLVIGGFTLQPHGADQQCCRSCMYYL